MGPAVISPLCCKVAAMLGTAQLCGDRGGRTRARCPWRRRRMPPGGRMLLRVLGLLPFDGGQARRGWSEIAS